MQNQDIKVREILTNHGLDFRIEKLPSVALRKGMGIDGEGNFTEVQTTINTPYFMLYNDKTGEIINSVKKGYEVSQNDEILELMLEGIQQLPSEYQNTLSVKTAGSINGGRKVFLQLAIEGDGFVNGDRIKRYITLIDSNDGSTGLSVGVGDLTMSCQNQFFQFNKSGQSKFKHTASLKARKYEIKTLVETQLKESFQLIETYNEFAKVDVTDKDIHQAVKNVYGYSRLDNELPTRVVNVLDVLYNDIGTEIAQKGKTVWGLHSGFTRWSTHNRNAPKRTHGRIESLMLTGNYKMNQKSFNHAKGLLALAN